MARRIDSLMSLLFLLVLLNSIFVAIEARPLNILKSSNTPASASIEGFIEGFYLGGIKDGPSPGQGHKFTNSQTLGGTKDSGPSPGEGHNYVTGTKN